VIRLSAKSLERLSVYLDDTERTKRMAKSARSSPLKELKLCLAASSSSLTGLNVLKTWLATCGDRCPPELVIQVDSEAETTLLDRLTYSTNRLDLETSFSTLDATIPFLPLDVTCLIDLHVSFCCTVPTFTLPRLPAFAETFSESRLTSLTISSGAVLDVIYDAEMYYAHDGACDLPLSFFSTFPHVLNFTLRGFTDMSVKKLSLLSSSSPHIASLDFAFTLWTFNIEDFLPFPPMHNDGEQQLINSLKRFSRLSSIDLGPLPYFEEDKYELGLLESLEEYCKGRNLGLAFEGMHEEDEEGKSEESSDDDEDDSGGDEEQGRVLEGVQESQGSENEEDEAEDR
jgi:hypothetical protein